MPYADIEKKRRMQREWRRRKRREDPVWHEAEKSYKRAYGHPEQCGENGPEYRAHQNENRWRFHLWELTHIDPLTRDAIKNLTHRTLLQITNPVFYVEIHGRIYRETLHDPLPTWEVSSCGA